MKTTPFLLRLLTLLATAFILALAPDAALAAAPNIVVEQPVGTDIPDGGSKDFGQVVAGSNTSLTFAIKNTGDANLAGLAITKDAGGTAGDFTVTNQPAPSVAGPGSTTFTVQFTPTGTGIRTATLHIANNDPVATKQLFDITVTGTGTAPEIVVEQLPGNQDVADNNALPVSLGTVDLGGSTPAFSDKSFSIRNTGDGNLTGLTVTGLAGTDFTVTAPPAATVGPGDTATFTVRFQPTTKGTKTAQLQIANNDSNENPFRVNLTAIASAPVMVVEQPAGTPFGNNATAAFPATPVGFASELTFTIKNTGDANLNLTAFTLGGTDQRVFALVGTPPAVVAPGLSSTFTVRFGPAEVGAFAANLTLANNSATNPFTINLAGTSTPNAILTDAFGYKCTAIAGGNILPFLVSTDAGVVTEGALTGIDRAVPLDIGFDFYFYDTAYSVCSVSTTGLVTFGGASINWHPDAIPNTASPDNFIAPLWTDLQVTPTSKILYKTVGAAPNRIFVVKFENVKLYHNGAAATDKRVTFQVQLFETTNAIQIRYLDNTPTVAAPPQRLTVGIESRNYLDEDPQPGVGIVGIQFKNGQFPASIPWEGDGSSILFTRPVVVTVESKYAKPTPTDPDPTATTATDVGTVALGLKPGIGTIYQTALGSVKRFEAPEFIYLSRSFDELPQAGEVDAPDASKAWYRLVNDGYAIDGQVVQGTHTFFTTTLTHDVTVVWRWRLEYAVTIESDTGEGGFGTPTPAVGRNWYPLGSQFTAAIDSVIQNAGAGFRYRTAGYTVYDKMGGIVSPGVNTAVQPAVLFPPDPYTYSDEAVGLARRGTLPLTMNRPLRIRWNFVGQVAYRFDAMNSNQPSVNFNGQAFVRVYKPDRFAPDTSYGPGGIVYANTLNTTVWIDSGDTAGRKVDIGAFYRPDQQAVTLTGFLTPPAGDLTGVTSINAMNDDTTVPDLQGQPRVSRIFTVRNAKAPTEFHWTYQSTVFRAEVPIGRSLDVETDGTVPSNQLIPALPTTAVLKVSDTGPGNLIVPKISPPDGSFSSGDPLRWDGLGKDVFPVRPGAYEIAWPDGNDSATSYRIEILTGYPGDTVTRTQGREAADGSRLRNGVVALTGCATINGSTAATCASTTGLAAGLSIRGPNIATGTTIASVTGGTSFVLSAKATGTDTGLALSAWASYQNTVKLPEIDPAAGFPAQAEHAHYRHLFDSVPGRQAPTKLDLSATDEWKFQDLTFADAATGATVNKATAGAPFTATGAGRSVLLFSYRPNPDEIADGTLTKENLAVRVVRSSAASVLARNDPKLVLGHHALKLGSGALGLIQNGGAPPTAVVPEDRFVVDFWLNAKGLQAPAAVTLSNCATLGGSTTVTCASTAGVVAGMSLSGATLAAGTKIASVTNGTTLVLSSPATASGNGLSITASNKPVTVFSTGGGGLTVTLDAAASMVTATYRGVRVSHRLSKAGIAWKHYAIHVFTHTFFGVGVTVVDFYLDGVREEQGFVTSWFPGSADSIVSGAVTDASLRFGVGAEPRSDLQLDNFRLFKLGADPLGYLSPAEVQRLRAERDMTPAGKGLRGVSPELSFDFESAPTSGWFANHRTLANVGVGPVTGSGTYADTWADADLQEVATQLTSTLDNAGFGGSGYIVNAVSNYNPRLYQRSAEIGAWGPIFPVNHSQLFTDAAKKLEVAYYENPYLTAPLPHPNVAWPYAVTEYKDVVFPTAGPHQDKAIYIASRIGSEGVDKTGHPQEVYDLARYSGLQIYHQPDKAAAGYNPNEEHALTAPSGRAALKVKNLGEDLANNPPLAAFALQQDLNNKPSYTSEPWVLVQVNNLESGEPEMAAYRVFDKRAGTIPFPRPVDSQVGGSTGLAYESAANPEQRFLTLAPATAFDFDYQFEYPVFAGDLLIPPYPLNLVIGTASMADERGGNIQINGVNQRTLWRDASLHAWVVSGGGKFFEQFFYPMRADFYLPGAAIGKPVAWLPATASTPAAFLGDSKAGTTDLDDDPKPVKVRYSSAWRSDYPKLKRGETLTYQGGEYFSENPGAKGLPAVVAMKAAEVVYDSGTPSMVIGAATTAELDKASARIVRPLDRREVPFTNAQMIAAGLVPGDPASSKVIVVAERWYFKDLTGSLQKRFYFDSLAETLVFRGRLNDKEGGDPNLTQGPDPINVLEPNVMTLDDYRKTAPDKGVWDISTDSAWREAVNEIFRKSQNPNGVLSISPNLSAPVFLQGVKSTPVDPVLVALLTMLQKFWKVDLTGYYSMITQLLQLDSFGVGSALVPNANLLTQTPTGPFYITIAENNRSELDGAPVSLHIIEIIPDRYRGAIKVIEGSDAFSERITLQHNGEFGANTGDLNYEWWIRDARQLDDTLKTEIQSLTTPLPDPDWQLYASGPALHTIVFQGRPDVVLADKLVLVRYRHKNETKGWKLVPFELPTGQTATAAWQPGSAAANAPFQWAGAANSPQLQADGSKRYIPQLVMGWVKRVLDRINPYEARYTDFFSNESPASYSSQIQIAGAPYAGNVALNPDKNVIENTGLIELYRTVLDRAESLSIKNSSNGNATDGINQALLLAATRLSVLYELLAQEAYSDAQDATINAGEDGALAGVASYTHAFQNMEADLMHEEIALLRGTDFRKSYPVYNRLFWNYAKGLGEAAYNVNYNIYDANKDGFINEDDARKLYPQGHGDAWGHFLSALEMHYLLLQEPNFSWKTRSELYSLMQNVLEVDFLDEKTFARLAAGKARAGRDIVRGTYRIAYTQDPDGQWQGYTDSADPARAWGVSEWAHRAGQGAYFDWAVANAIIPAEAAGTNPENLDHLERLGAIDEIGGIAGGLHEIQTAMDEANSGVNPLGFDSDALAFDIDTFYDGQVWELKTHFEQIYDRAVEAAGNALATLGSATQAANKLRTLGDDTESLIVDSLRQDLDYRNRLIEIFGRPYAGQIGFGKAYPEGYEGPDTMLYAYLDKTRIDQIVPSNASADPNVVTFTTINTAATGMMNHSKMISIYNKAGSASIAKDFATLVGNSLYGPETASGPFTAPYNTASKYGFQAPSDWGQRTSYGRVQTALGDMLSAEIGLDAAIADYIAFLQDYEQKLRNLQSEVELFGKKDGKNTDIVITRATIHTAKVVADGIITGLQIADDLSGKVAEAVEKSIPTSIGFSNDVLAPARGAAVAAAVAARTPLNIAKQVVNIGKEVADLISEEVVAALERDKGYLDEVAKLQGLVADLEYHSGGDQPKRDTIGAAVQALTLKQHEYTTALAEGFRLLKEREAFNKVLAAKSQKNRYQDMIFRLARNEAMGKYQSSFNAAARYAWLAARAYDYETSLDPGHPAAPGALLDRIVKERQLGLWTDGQPQVGHGGLAEILAQLKANFGVLRNQLGINNPQPETEKISLRSELFRIGAAGDGASDDRWKDVLKARFVPDLNTMPEFVRHCRPFAAGVQPGMVIRFGTFIEPGRNFFGQPLAPGDHNYSAANFATKIHSFGVWLDNYNAAGLSTSPRAYLVPVGNDYMRTSTSALPVTRQWSVVEQRIPTPFTINESDLTSPGYIPTLDGVDGVFGDLRRHGDFRMYHDEGGAVDDSETISSSRLYSRSVWNSEWLLIIPGANLHADPTTGMAQLANTITDIKLYFLTYSHQGE